MSLDVILKVFVVTRRLQRVLEELVFTEREYVRSLGYILTHYLPLLGRPDIPQDLRGKRSIIFGNLEKLYDFHSHYFLPELEACQKDAAMVARCFLRHVSRNCVTVTIAIVYVYIQFSLLFMCTVYYIMFKILIVLFILNCHFYF